MTYGRVALATYTHAVAGAAVSHSAELVRGNYLGEGPLIRPFGPPSPQGEKRPPRGDAGPLGALGP
jgi:hypothetical protein